MLIADFAYLCMPKKNFPIKLKEILKKYGVGLGSYDPEKKEFQEVLPPVHSFIQQAILKKRTLQYLNKINENIY